MATEDLPPGFAAYSPEKPSPTLPEATRAAAAGHGDRASSATCAAPAAPPSARRRYSHNDLMCVLSQMPSAQLCVRPQGWVEDRQCSAAAELLQANLWQLYALITAIKSNFLQGEFARIRPKPPHMQRQLSCNGPATPTSISGSSYASSGSFGPVRPIHHAVSMPTNVSWLPAADAAPAADASRELGRPPGLPDLRPIKTVLPQPAQAAAIDAPTSAAAAAAAAGGCAASGLLGGASPQAAPTTAAAASGLATPQHTSGASPLPEVQRDSQCSFTSAAQQASSSVSAGGAALSPTHAAAAQRTRLAQMLQELLQGGATAADLRWLIQLPGFAGAMGPFSGSQLAAWLLQGKPPHSVRSKQVLEVVSCDSLALRVCGVAPDCPDGAHPPDAFYRPLKQLVALPAAGQRYMPATASMLRAGQPPAAWNSPAPGAPSSASAAAASGAASPSRPDATAGGGAAHRQDSWAPAGGARSPQHHLQQRSPSASAASGASGPHNAHTTAVAHISQAVKLHAPEADVAHALVADLLSTLQASPSEQPQLQERAAMAAAASALAGFAGHSSSNRHRLVAAGAVPPLVKLLTLPLMTAGGGQPHQAAADALFALAGGLAALRPGALSDADMITQESIAAAGSIEALTQLLAGAWRRGGSADTDAGAGAEPVTPGTPADGSWGHGGCLGTLSYGCGAGGVNDDDDDEYGCPKKRPGSRGGGRKQRAPPPPKVRPTSGTKEERAVAAAWQMAAAQALAALAACPRVKAIMASEGCAAVARLIRLLGSNRDGVVTAALAALQQLMRAGDTAVDQAICACGGVAMLVQAAGRSSELHACTALQLLHQLSANLSAAPAAAAAAAPAAGAAASDSCSGHSHDSFVQQLFVQGFVPVVLGQLAVLHEPRALKHGASLLLQVLTRTTGQMRKVALSGAYYYEQCEFDDQRQRPRTLQTGMGVLAQLRAHADEELLALVNGILRELSQAGFIGRAQPRKLL